MSQAPVGPAFVIRNQSKLVTANQAWEAAAALARQVNEHFARPAPHGWGLGCRGIRVEATGAAALHDEWVILLSDSTDEDALGYHDQEIGGKPFLVVLPLLDAQDGVAWPTTVSHEILEALADPNCSLSSVGSDGRIRALEVCDAVEADSYEIDGVPVSDFILPAWLEPVEGAIHFDYMGRCKAPGEIRPDGYCSFYEKGEWTDYGPDGKPARKRSARQARGTLSVSRVARRNARGLQSMGHGKMGG